MKLFNKEILEITIGDIAYIDLKCGKNSNTYIEKTESREKRMNGKDGKIRPFELVRLKRYNKIDSPRLIVEIKEIIEVTRTKESPNWFGEDNFYQVEFGGILFEEIVKRVENSRKTVSEFVKWEGLPDDFEIPKDLKSYFIR